MSLYLSTCDYIFLAGTYRLSRTCTFFSKKTSSIGSNSVSAHRNRRNIRHRFGNGILLKCQFVCSFFFSGVKSHVFGKVLNIEESCKGL